MNIANKLTMLRIALVPVLILFMYVNNLWTRIFALVIFSTAALTDTFDGYLARKHNTITTLGKFLDPLADKLLVSAALVSFVGLRELHIPSWMIVLIISREFIISGLRSLAATKDTVIAAHMSGKFKTTSQMVAIIITMIILIINAALWQWGRITATDLMRQQGWVSTAGWMLAHLPYWLMFITTILTIYSGYSYLDRYRALLSEQ